MIRPLQPSDYPEIERMIQEIGEPMSRVKAWKTYLMDGKGFFTYSMYKGVPILQHFYISKEHRSTKNARELVKEYVKHIKGLGCKYSIIAVEENYLKKMVEYYFKVIKSNIKFILVEV